MVLLVAFLVPGLLAERAEAQLTSFQCPDVLPVCDSTSGVTDCCYRPFSAGSIIVPMDRCHQVLASGNPLAPPNSAASPKWCADPGPGQDNGVFMAYGLVYRLMQQGIPVYWIVNPTKDPPRLTDQQTLGGQTYTERDIDFWATGFGCTGPTQLGSPLPGAMAGCDPPVLRLDPGSLAPVVGSYTRGTIPFRGAAFVIDAADRAAFDAFWLTFTGTGGKYDFDLVDLYELQPGAIVESQDFTSAGPSYTRYGGGGSVSVAVTLDYAPPRLARIGQGNVSATWLGTAKLADPAPAGCNAGAWSNDGVADAVVCNVTDAQVVNGDLVTGGFGMAWFDGWQGNTSCANPTTSAEVNQIATFLTGVPMVRTAGNAMFMGPSVPVVEECPNIWKASLTGVVGDTGAPVERLIIRHPEDALSQWGDWPTTFQGGSGVAKWHYTSGAATGYNPARTSLVRLVTEEETDDCVWHRSTAACDTAADTIDVMAYYRLYDDTDNGFAFYLAGQNPNGQSYTAQLRAILNALLVAPAGLTPQAPPLPTEVARGGPVTVAVAGVGLAQFQGTYGVYTGSPPPTAPVYAGGSASLFSFPWIYGHMRAIDVNSLATGSAVDFASAPQFFDANEWLESNVSDPDDRTVFTNTTTGPNPTVVQLSDSGAAAALQADLGVADAADAQTLIDKVRVGWNVNGTPTARLGGVDRSTVVVVDSSRVAGPTRPTVIYFGALDGMLHAVCASVDGATCTALGQELWAFIPRVQLGRLRSNTGRIDGSPKAFDMFDDFDGDGTREWKTLLAFQTGSTDVSTLTSAAYVIDITSPATPVVLWERVLDGMGLHVAMGPVQVSSQKRNTIFITTNSGNALSPGIRVLAVDAVTGQGSGATSCASSAGGAVHWEVCQAYTLPAPFTAAPGGPAAADLEGFNTTTDVVFTTLEGKLYRVSAVDGQAPTGVPEPLLEFVGSNHPIGAAPTLWRDAAGSLHAIAVSGGYVDNVVYNTVWAPLGTFQCVASVPLDGSGGTVQVTAGASCSASGGSSDFALSLGSSARAFAQATVAGGTLYVVTDSDIEPNAENFGLVANTGHLYTVNLAMGAFSDQDIQVSSGVGEVDASGGFVYVGGGRGVEKELPMFDSLSGGATELIGSFRTARRLWLRIY